MPMDVGQELLWFVALFNGQWHGDAPWPTTGYPRVAASAAFDAEAREVMGGLVCKGLIESRPNPSLGPPDRYWLTEGGRRAVAVWASDR
jgi:hypothetical protein